MRLDSQREEVANWAKAASAAAPIEVANSRCPENNAERTMHFKAQLAGKQARRRVICQQPFYAELAGQSNRFRFAKVQQLRLYPSICLRSM